MPLLKNGDAATISRNAVVLNLGNLRRLADDVIERARFEAQQILETARVEAQRLIDAADGRGFQQGFARGEKSGEEEGRAKGQAQALAEIRPRLEEIAETWSGLAERIESERLRMYLEAQQDVLALGVAIGRKIVHRVPLVDADVVKDQVAAAVATVLDPSVIVLAISPDDRPLIEEFVPALAERLGGTTQIRIVDDPTIQRGGCLVRTSRGCIDARLSVQLDRLVTALLPEQNQGDSPAVDDEAPLETRES